jgi:hypothetical protein
VSCGATVMTLWPLCSRTAETFVAIFAISRVWFVAR